MVATLVLAVLAGTVGGVVLASVAGARRTATAMDRFVEWHRPGTLFLEYEPGSLDEAAVAELPQVAAAATGSYVLLSPSRADGSPDPGTAGAINPFLLIPRTGGESNRLMVVEGRLPKDPGPFEIAVDEELAERRDLRPGDRLRMWGSALIRSKEPVSPPRDRPWTWRWFGRGAVARRRGPPGQ